MPLQLVMIRAEMRVRQAVLQTACSLTCLAVNTASVAEQVTVDNFVRAETDMTMKR